MELDTISIDGIQDITKISLLNTELYHFDVELWVKCFDQEDCYTLYTVQVMSTKWVGEIYSKNDMQLNGCKYFIFKDNLNYEELFNLFSRMVQECIGRDFYESSILLQRYFEEQDICFSSPKEYYYYLFDKIKKNKHHDR